MKLAMLSTITLVIATLSLTEGQFQMPESMSSTTNTHQGHSMSGNQGSNMVNSAPVSAGK